MRMPWVFALLGILCCWPCVSECGSARNLIVAPPDEDYDVLPIDAPLAQAAGAAICAPGMQPVLSSL